ncbi:MAG: ABC transporter permease subunit [Candidatus Thorarchaeota archaeon]|nr:MAG: ABC transporter permease subunit [Candidatus Thorarchaeota archaeon]
MTLWTDLLEITLRSIFVSGVAALLAALIGIPVGVLIGLRRFRGRSQVKGVFNGLMAMPTVALGLVLYLVFSNAGPLGFLQVLYSPFAIIIGQAILVFPLLVSISSETVETIDPSIRDLALTLGADEREASVSVLRESLGGIVLAVSASFSRAISELGIALMLGGNIEGLTRVLTSSIALETTRGEIILGLGLTVILLSLMIIFNILLRMAEKRLRWWLWE